MKKLVVSCVLGIFAVYAIACEAHEGHKHDSMKSTGNSAVDDIRSEIVATQKATAKKVFSEDIEITEKPNGAKNWGEWVIKNNNLDTKKWKSAKIKGTSMWGIAPVLDGKNDCGAVLWICQHTKRLVFNAEKLSENGACGELKASYKNENGEYKKVIVPFTF